MSTRTGVALVISAPSGAGKTTLVNKLRQEFPEFAYSVSCTTRDPREGEQDGVDYHFIDRETFEKRVEAEYFAEWAQVHGNYYGTPLAQVEAMLEQGRDLLFDIDVQGARQLKNTLPGRYVFILPPSREELRRRLTGRGTDEPETIDRRVANAAAEIRQARLFDCLVVNDDLDQAYDELRAAFVSARLNPNLSVGLLDEILQDWEG